MAREVNIYTGGWRATGKSISVPQYEVTVTLDWVDDAGAAHTRTETLKFPNFLATVGAADLKEWITELMLREARQRLGVDA
jgi:hypothetical protein